MSRIRTIKPQIIDDEKAAALPDDAWRLWVSTWVLADDEGRLPGGVHFLHTRIFWAQNKQRRVVQEAFDRLVKDGFLIPYRVHGAEYVQIRTFRRHQYINRPSPPKFPGPDQDDRGEPDTTESSVNAHGGNGASERSPVAEVIHGGLTESSLRDRDQGSGSGSGSGEELTERSLNDHGIAVRQRQQVNSELWKQHDRTVRDLQTAGVGNGARFVRTQGEIDRQISALVLSYVKEHGQDAGLIKVREDATHVLAVLAAEARETRSLRYLDEGLWKPERFQKAALRSLDEFEREHRRAASTATTNAATIPRMPGRVGGRWMWFDGDNYEVMSEAEIAEHIPERDR